MLEKLSRTKVIKKIEGNVTLNMIGSIKNEYGEEYLLYSTKDNIFITGDEFSWKMGYRLIRSLFPESLVPFYTAIPRKGHDAFSFNSEEMVYIHQLLQEDYYENTKRR